MKALINALEQHFLPCKSVLRTQALYTDTLVSVVNRGFFHRGLDQCVPVHSTVHRNYFTVHRNFDMYKSFFEYVYILS